MILPSEDTHASSLHLFQHFSQYKLRNLLRHDGLSGNGMERWFQQKLE